MDRCSEILAQGCAAWPGVEVSQAELSQWIAARAGTEGAELHGADLYLACACARGDAAALDAFERRYLAQVPQHLARMHTSRDLIDEVKQQLRVRLFTGERPRITEYSGRGPLAGWLRIAALRTALNLQRQAAAATPQRAGDEPPQDARGDDPEDHYVKAQFRPEFEAALRDALGQLDARERNLLRFHFLERVSLDRLAVMFGVHRATVVRWLAAARRRTIEHTFDRLRASMAVSETELEGVLQIVRSQLDVSLRRLLT